MLPRRGAGLTLALLVGLASAAAADPIPRPPSGYYAHGKVVIRAHHEVYGRRFWDPYMLAQIEQESGWRLEARSPVGARGLTQFMPQTEAAIRRQYQVRGSIYDPDVAARLQAYLMRDNARWCAARGFVAFHQAWGCALRIYNGSPAAFARELAAAGEASLEAMRPICRRARRAWCRENIEYPERICARRPKYVALHGGPL